MSDIKCGLKLEKIGSKESLGSQASIYSVRKI
jgi:hypothetical protein